MAKGTPAVVVRLPPVLRQWMEEEIAKRDLNPLVPPWTKTDFICEAIREFVKHKRRSRQSRPRRTPKRKGTEPQRQEG